MLLIFFCKMILFGYIFIQEVNFSAYLENPELRETTVNSCKRDAEDQKDACEVTYAGDSAARDICKDAAEDVKEACPDS